MDYLQDTLLPLMSENKYNLYTLQDFQVAMFVIGYDLQWASMRNTNTPCPTFWFSTFQIIDSST